MIFDHQEKKKRRSKYYLICLLLIPLISVACASTQKTAPMSAVPQAFTETPAVTRQQPKNPESAPGTLTILAAASLTEAFTEMGQIFESQHPGAAVEFSFGGSQQLAQQFNQGAPADVFASANTKYMDSAIQSGRVVEGAARVFANNRLVVIYPQDNPASVKTLKDLAKPGLKLVLAAKEVPVGKYSLDFLDKAILDPSFGGSFKEDVLKNVVSYEQTVKAVLTKVALAEADAGIVYLSDISTGAVFQVDKLDIPKALNVVATYPIAVINDSQHPDLAQAFVDFVLSPTGQDVLKKYNFIPAR
jgi:molybdate transport system substrate-binding protein